MVISHTESDLTSLQNPGLNMYNLFSVSVNILLTNISFPVILDIFSKLKISRYYSHLKDCKIVTINVLSSLIKQENMHVTLPTNIIQIYFLSIYYFYSAANIGNRFLKQC